MLSSLPASTRTCHGGRSSRFLNWPRRMTTARRWRRRACFPVVCVADDETENTRASHPPPRLTATVRRGVCDGAAWSIIAVVVASLHVQYPPAPLPPPRPRKAPGTLAATDEKPGARAKGDILLFLRVECVRKDRGTTQINCAVKSSEVLETAGSHTVENGPPFRTYISPARSAGGSEQSSSLAKRE